MSRLCLLILLAACEPASPADDSESALKWYGPPAIPQMSGGRLTLFPTDGHIWVTLSGPDPFYMHAKANRDLAPSRPLDLTSPLALPYLLTMERKGDSVILHAPFMPAEDLLLFNRTSKQPATPYRVIGDSWIYYSHEPWLFPGDPPREQRLTAAPDDILELNLSDQGTQFVLDFRTTI
jgi:hypothetical protein